MLVADALAVEAQLVSPQRGRVEPRLAHGARQRKGFAEQRNLPRRQREPRVLGGFDPQPRAADFALDDQALADVRRRIAAQQLVRRHERSGVRGQKLGDSRGHVFSHAAVVRLV